MSTPDTLDFDAILQPIAGDNPAGRDLRTELAPTAPYRALREARNNARRIERTRETDPDFKEEPDWRPILDLGPKVIAKDSKDLEVAAWITEGLVRTRGFAGLRDGFRLCRELIERFWDGLHPLPDPEEPADELSRRVAPLAGLNDGAIIGPIERVSIIDPKELGALGVAAYEQAAALEQITDTREREIRIRQGAVPLADFNKAAGASSADFYRTLVADLDAAALQFEQLSGALDARCGSNGPATSTIRETLDKCQRRVRTLAADKLGFVPPAAEAGAAVAAGSSSDGPRMDGQVRSREEAFALLRQVADFFRRTEPQSLLPFHLDECVRFGRMNLPELLTELINDSSVREALFKRVGIPAPRQD